MDVRAPTVFDDRADAGRQLAERLSAWRGRDVVVLGLPRGGVPVAAEVARALDAPLDVVVVRKLGVPYQPELAMGAIGEGGVRVVDRVLMARAGVTDAELARIERRERAVLDARAARLRRGRPRLDVSGRTVLVVDDGLATGATARAACQVARRLGAAHVVVAVPVAPEATVRSLAEADEVVCVSVPRDFLAVGVHYRDFGPTTEDEVVVALDAAARRRSAAPSGPGPGTAAEVAIPAGPVTLAGTLDLPDPVTGIVVFAHGSGSSRRSPRNRFVAGVLRDAGLGTLLFDLLTPPEERDRRNVFDIALLGRRLADATDWLAARPEAAGASVGYFGASTGAAAALYAAADPGSAVAAVVSRGGRPDLAGDRLPLVRAPVLLVVGGDDREVLELNRRAQRQLRCPSELAVVPGATHLFEEAGTLAEAALLARDWFLRYLTGGAA